MDTFKVIVPKDLLKYPGYTRSEATQGDTTALHWAIESLGNRYLTREWYTALAAQKFTWYFEDIGYIWDELPAILHAVKVEPREFPMFSTLSQGSEKIVYIEAENPHDVLITIVSSEQTELFWEYYNGQYQPDENEFPRIRVVRADFIAEWIQFIQTIVRMIVNEALIDRNDASLRAYLQRLP